MNKNIKVHLKQNSYNIIIGNKILSKIGIFLRDMPIGKDAVIITTRPINRLHGSSLMSGLKGKGYSAKVLEVPDTEKSKSAKEAIRLLEKIAKYDTKKKVFIIAFGGGVVGDLAGFIAAIYKRGVPYIQIPTTFLAQIDSAIGGKTAIDLSIGKNLVGAFYQPKLVFSDVSILSTLSQRQVKNGLAEAVKYGVISDRKLFFYLRKNFNKILATEAKALTKVVLRCSQIKARVVERDERETKKIRTILNFGHTAGHAIEAAGGYRQYHHGEAIALGMRIVAYISVQMGLLSKANCQYLNNLLTDIGLPLKIKKLSVSNIIKIMQHDKKFLAKKNRFVLPVRIGHVRVVDGISQGLIKKAVKKFC